MSEGTVKNNMELNISEVDSDKIEKQIYTYMIYVYITPKELGLQKMGGVYIINSSFALDPSLS